MHFKLVDAHILYRLTIQRFLYNNYNN